MKQNTKDITDGIVDGFKLGPTDPVSPQMPFGNIFTLFMRCHALSISVQTYFYRLLNNFSDRHFLFSLTFLFRWKVKKLTKPGPDIKFPVLNHLILVFHIPSLTIATTKQKQILPFIKKQGEGQFLQLTQTTAVLFLCLTTVVQHKLTRLSHLSTEQQHTG